MKTLIVIIVFAFVSLTSFAQKVQIIEDELKEKPLGMRYDDGMQPSCVYQPDYDANLPSMEDVDKQSILDDILNQVEKEEENKEAHLIRNDVEDTAHLIRNDVYDEV